MGPETNVVGKVYLAPGHSSPVVVNDRIYLTAVRDKRLYTMALAKKNGKLLWEREALTKELEKIHQVSSHAASTCAADGQVVVSFFGSCGLFCYDSNGRELWHQPLGPFRH